VATDDDRQAAEATEFQKKLDAMVTATDDVKKRYDTGRAWVLAATTLLEEEECVTTILTKEACTTAALIKPPSPTPPPAPAGGAVPLDDDYEVAVIANIHV
jgi:hypothetical protein